MSSSDYVLCQSGLWKGGQGRGKGRTRLTGDQILQTLGSMQQLLTDSCVYVRVNGCDVCYVHPDARESTGAKWVAQSGQSMPKPSQPSLMASCSTLCTSSYESYVGRHSWLKHVCAVGSVLWVGAAIIWKEGQRAAKPPGGS